VLLLGESVNRRSCVKFNVQINPLSHVKSSYRQAERPQKSITYTLSPASSNTMLLIPPEDSPNTRPKFHVSVGECMVNIFVDHRYDAKTTLGMNPLIPLSYITSERCISPLLESIN